MKQKHMNMMWTLANKHCGFGKSIRVRQGFFAKGCGLCRAQSPVLGHVARQALVRSASSRSPSCKYRMLKCPFVAEVLHFFDN